MKVLVFIEQRAGKIKASAYEALAMAAELSGSGADNQEQNELHAVLIGRDVGDLAAQLQGYGISTLHSVAAEALELYNPLHWTTALQAAVEACQPQLLLGIASPLGRDLLARLAARLDCGLLSDVVQAEVSGAEVQALKPMYAGKCLAKMKLNCAPRGILAVRPNVFAPAQPRGTDAPQVQAVAVELPEVPLVTKEIRKGASEKPDLTEAPTIISGGRAMASAENFKILHECAEVISATVGASRAAVDAGYAPHDMQVGQTGKTVNPNLYIACGISGSVQHMAGMRTSKVIVAVNTDEEAPVFSIASYGIVGDLFEVVPLLTQKFTELLDKS